MKWFIGDEDLMDVLGSIFLVIFCVVSFVLLVGLTIVIWRAALA
jgi:hypothetical protein